MANVVITDRLPAVPDVAGTKITNSVDANVLGGACDVLNHLVGWRSLKSGHWQVTQPGTDDQSGSIILKDPKGTVHHHFAYRPGVRAEHLQLVFAYQAATLATSQVDVWVTKFAGGVVDGTSVTPALSFVSADGTLPLGDETVATANTTTTHGYPIGFISTGTRLIPTPSLPTRPRLLNISAGAGVACIISVRVTDTNLISLSAFEHYRELIAQ